MRRHWNRTSYYIVGEGVITEPQTLFGLPEDSIVHAAPATPSPSFKFGRMLGQETIDCLVNLGKSMGKAKSEDSGIPSGYTYLGQFIAHEITFDRTKDLPANEPVPDNDRSPQIDMDSLYGASDKDGNRLRPELYESQDGNKLRIGETYALTPLPSYSNDLPRDEKGVAVIGDERNDENLAVAQFHVAFIRFHNKMVDTLAPSTPANQLFETARAEVVRHFEWIVLYDYLRTLVDHDVLSDLRISGPKLFKVSSPEELFMPLEFSAAAFRLGHSMVRATYEWNYHHSTEQVGKLPVRVSQLFEQTEFSGKIGKGLPVPANLHLPSEWVIDWRRFFDFKDFSKYPPSATGINRARRIDTSIEMELEMIHEFPHGPLSTDRQSIAVRNLLRGYALGLPSGEEVARWIGADPLTDAEIAFGYDEWLSSRTLRGKTPLWYYILREADLKGKDRLGQVGSRILAETFVGLIKNSRYSILDGSKWEPREELWRTGSKPGAVTFEMVDLLNWIDVVNPIG